jgi:hypothetical protein
MNHGLDLPREYRAQALLGVQSSSSSRVANGRHERRKLLVGRIL